MIKKLAYIVASCFLVISFSSCSFLQNCTEGVGNIVEKEITIDDFEKLDLGGSYNVFLTQGEEQKVIVKAQANLIDLINTKVSRKKWKIDFDPCVENSEGIEIYITSVDLTDISINGSGTISGESIFKTNKLNLEINGSGNMNLLLDVKELSSAIKGSGDLNLEGVNKKHKININGSGDVNTYDLESAEVEIEINGSGDVKVDVSYSLNAKVNGSGNIYYKGSVKEIQSKINGSGQLKQAN